MSDVVTSSTPEEAVAAMLGEPFVPLDRAKRRGRPPGSKNRPKDEQPKMLSIPAHKITKYAPKDVEGFLAELSKLVDSWREGEQRPILYDFEAAEQINALKRQFGIVR